MTPEGVILELETAGLASRVLARALDLVIVSAVGYLLLLALAVAAPPTWLFIALAVAVVFVALLVYPAVMEALWRGRTVGKAATGIRVLTDEGGSVRFRHAAIRSVLSLVDIGVTSGFAGVVSIVLSPRDQRLGDLAAGTIVVRDRGALGRRATAVQAPTRFAAFSATLDVGAVTEAERQIARDVLMCRGSLASDTYRAFVDRAAALLDERLGGRRPAQMTSETFVQCVVSASAPAGGPDAVAAPELTAPAARVEPSTAETFSAGLPSLDPELGSPDGADGLGAD